MGWGTGADVVPLDGKNVILVESGLLRIRRNIAFVGINSLLTIAGKSIERCSSQDFGFIVGPRLNAAGRLDDMSIGIECLLSDDYTQALQYATTLNQMNIQRRQIEGEMLEQALRLLDDQILLLDKSDSLPNALAIYDEKWHQGVVGLLASRIKEKFHRPVIAFADAGNGEIKGSGRSIQGLHIRDVLDAVATKHSGLIDKFGGHAMAAGLSMKKSAVQQFEKAFNEVVKRQADKEILQGVIESDGELSGSEFSLPLAEAIRNAGPWGQGFIEPLFDGEFEVLDWRVVGEKHLKMELQAEDAEQSISAIAFNAPIERMKESNGYIRAAYRLDVNEFRNKKTAQLIVEYFEAI